MVKESQKKFSQIKKLWKGSIYFSLANGGKIKGDKPSYHRHRVKGKLGDGLKQPLSIGPRTAPDLSVSLDLVMDSAPPGQTLDSHQVGPLDWSITPKAPQKIASGCDKWGSQDQFTASENDLETIQEQWQVFENCFHLAKNEKKKKRVDQVQKRKMWFYDVLHRTALVCG